jgi:hypothetical protein
MVKDLFFILVIIFLSVGCKGPLSSPGAAEVKPGMHRVVVDEVIQAGEYTYLYVIEKGEKIWLALPLMKATVGDTFYFTRGLEMKNFHSKELNRTFTSIFFLGSISREPISEENSGMNKSKTPGKVKAEKINISIKPGEGCISIANLYSNKAAYTEKTIRVRGKITKFNPAILGKNWIHIQDGSEFNDAFDLTITTDSQSQIGDTVTFEGKITLNKDFGYGYFYEVIMEGGKLIR